jgi:membrane protease YdiL (CAAX protease family)
MMGSLPLLAVLWPIINGVSLRETLRTLGLAPQGTWPTIKDLFVAPFAYSAMWVVLFPVLMIYAATIQWLEIDMASGAHPIFIWMSKPGSGSKGPSFLLLFILASVLAPILEEIMFRGALYSWLRLRLGVAMSLISSGVLFAAIHPQGLLGLLPLTACAVTFGMLREWRGTLWSSMIVHAFVNGISLGIFSLFMSAT